MIIKIKKPHIRLRADMGAIAKKTGVILLTGLYSFMPVFSVVSFLTVSGFLFAPKVNADYFYGGGGNPFYCAFGSTVGVQHSSIGSSVGYNSGQIQGAGAGSIQSNPVSSVTAINGYYGDRYDTMRHVSVPPGSTVEIGYWVWNLTGHHVNVPRVDLFTSRPNPSEGDITRLGASGNYGTVCDAVGGCRTGKFITLGDQGGYVYDSGGNAGGRVVNSFTTIQPIQQVAFTATPQWSGANLTMRYDLTLRNVSTYSVGNIRVFDSLPSGAVYDQTHSFNSGETRTITYFDNWGTSYPSSFTNNVRIYDNNTYTESTSRPKSNPNDVAADTMPAFIWRDDAGAPSGWAAPQGTWASNYFSTFSVSIIPYYFDSNTITTDLTPRIQINKTVSDSDESNVTSNTSNNRENLTYNITVTNNGGRANNVVVTDNYDQNYINIIDTDGGNDNGDVISWDIPVIEHGETYSFTVGAEIQDLAQGDYIIPNSVTTNIPGSNSSIVNTNVNPRVVLNISKLVSDSDESLVETNTIQGHHYSNNERRLTFQIEYSNQGDTDAHNVTLVDDLNEFANNNLILAVENVSGGGSFDSSTNLISWDIGLLPDGEAGIFTFDLLVERIAENDRNILNTATIDSEETESISDQTVTNIITPILQIVKTDNTNEASPSDTLQYSIAVSNNGTGQAFNLRIEDTLPEYVSLLEDTLNPIGSFNGNRTILWEDTLTEGGIILNSGDTLTFSYSVLVPEIMPSGTTTLINNVGLTIPGIETITTSDETHILSPQLELIKVQNLPEVVAPGQPISYTLTYRNTGTGSSPNTTLIDTIPEHTIFVAIDEANSDSTGVFEIDSNRIVWDIGTLDAGEEGSVTFTVVIQIPTPTDTQIRNTAVIYSRFALEVQSETITATTSACCMGGFIWDDNNKDGIYNEEEFGIRNARIRLSWGASEYLPAQEVELFTDSNGHYSYTGLPYYMPLDVVVEIPNGFDEFTTKSSYRIALLPPSPDGEIVDYEENGVRYVTASGCINFLNAGIYRDIIIAETGDSILIPILTGTILIAGGLALIIFAIRKRNK